MYLDDDFIQNLNLNMIINKYFFILDHFDVLLMLDDMDKSNFLDNSCRILMEGFPEILEHPGFTERMEDFGKDINAKNYNFLVKFVTKIICDHHFMKKPFPSLIKELIRACPILCITSSSKDNFLVLLYNILSYDDGFNFLNNIDKSICPFVLNCMQDESYYVRQQATRTLAKFLDEEASISRKSHNKFVNSYNSLLLKTCKISKNDINRNKLITSANLTIFEVMQSVYDKLLLDDNHLNKLQELNFLNNNVMFNNFYWSLTQCPLKNLLSNIMNQHFILTAKTEHSYFEHIIIFALKILAQGIDDIIKQSHVYEYLIVSMKHIKYLTPKDIELLWLLATNAPIPKSNFCELEKLGLYTKLHEHWNKISTIIYDLDSISEFLHKLKYLDLMWGCLFQKTLDLQDEEFYPDFRARITRDYVTCLAREADAIITSVGDGNDNQFSVNTRSSLVKTFCKATNRLASTLLSLCDSPLTAQSERVVVTCWPLTAKCGAILKALYADWDRLSDCSISRDLTNRLPECVLSNAQLVTRHIGKSPNSSQLAAILDFTEVALRRKERKIPFFDESSRPSTELSGINVVDWEAFDRVIFDILSTVLACPPPPSWIDFLESAESQRNIDKVLKMVDYITNKYIAGIKPGQSFNCQEQALNVLGNAFIWSSSLSDTTDSINLTLIKLYETFLNTNSSMATLARIWREEACSRFLNNHPYLYLKTLKYLENIVCNYDKSFNMETEDDDSETNIISDALLIMENILNLSKEDKDGGKNMKDRKIKEIFRNIFQSFKEIGFIDSPEALSILNTLQVNCKEEIDKNFEFDQVCLQLITHLREEITQLVEPEPKLVPKCPRENMSEFLDEIIRKIENPNHCNSLECY